MVVLTNKFSNVIHFLLRHEIADGFVDSGLVLLYWSIGHRIRTEVLDGKRAVYGKEIVSAVGRQLAVEFSEGFSDKNLRHMIRFAEVFPEPSILQSLITKLSWPQFRTSSV